MKINRFAILLFVFSLGCQSAASIAVLPQMPLEQTPNCWISLNKCRGDAAEFVYFVGEGKADQAPPSQREQWAKRGAKAMALANFSAMLGEDIQRNIVEQSLCKGGGAEGQNCMAELTKKTIATTQGQFPAERFEVVDEYFWQERQTFFVRIRVRESEIRNSVAKELAASF